MDENNGAVRIANAIIELSLEDLRSCGKKLSTEEAIDLAESLIDESLDFECKETATKVRRFSSALALWRDAREFFVYPTSSLKILCEVLNLDPEAVRGRIKEECALPFNTKLAADAASEFMLFRQRYVNKS
jgi:hypothetical protein